MPALPADVLSPTLLLRDASSNGTGPDAPIQVMCAFPVSGQYGPGSRFLYYALVCACIFAQRIGWLRHACLAAALLLPAIAAVHGIVLAFCHVPGAIDLDLYGALQLCAIGILAAPVTARRSSTYFDDPGRNVIFLWTILLLAGLLSLTVEFFRTGKATFDCTHNSTPNNPVYVNSSGPHVSSNFNYGSDCSIPCDPTGAQYSPLRQGSANNIYVVPIPYILTFGTATLCAAACCIPAVLTLVSMWDNILVFNYKDKNRNKVQTEDSRENDEAEQVNIEEKKKVSAGIKKLLKFIEVPFFGAAVIAILFAGEFNFLEGPLYYQTENFASIGQWSPIAGTLFALLGSIYLIIARRLRMLKDKDKNKDEPCPYCKHTSEASSDRYVPSDRTPSLLPGTEDNSRNLRSSPRETANNMQHVESSPSENPIQGSRLKFGERLGEIFDKISMASEKRFDNSIYQRKALGRYPILPGEEFRNIDLARTQRSFRQWRDEDESIAPSRSRDSSREGSVRSSPRAVSPSSAAPRSPSLGNTLVPPTPFSNRTPSRSRTRRATADDITAPSFSPPSRRSTVAEGSTRRPTVPQLTISVHRDSPSPVRAPSPVHKAPQR